MKALEVYNLLTIEQRKSLFEQYDLANNPQHNGGVYLSPNDAKDAFNNILSKVMGKAVKMPANSQNALLNMLEGA